MEAVEVGDQVIAGARVVGAAGHFKSGTIGDAIFLGKSASPLDRGWMHIEPIEV